MMVWWKEKGTRQIHRSTRRWLAVFHVAVLVHFLKLPARTTRFFFGTTSPCQLRHAPLPPKPCLWIFKIYSLWHQWIPLWDKNPAAFGSKNRKWNVGSPRWFRSTELAQDALWLFLAYTTTSWNETLGKYACTPARPVREVSPEQLCGIVRAPWLSLITVCVLYFFKTDKRYAFAVIF